MVVLERSPFDRLEALVDAMARRFPARPGAERHGAFLQFIASELVERYRHEGRVIDLATWLAARCGPDRIIPFPRGRRKPR